MSQEKAMEIAERGHEPADVLAYALLIWRAELAEARARISHTRADLQRLHKTLRLPVK
jgi:hypothetical protein